ncbi:MAG: hypothetical protein IKE43_00860 [Coriobacteriales bacterium]|nr:hypothetical protein [Coriobacteriales bacterium]
MITVIPVRLHYSPVDFWFDPQDTEAVYGDHVIVSTERGTEFGLVTGDAFDVAEEDLKSPLKPVLRVATQEDIEYAEELALKGEEAMPGFRQLIKKHELDMKPVGIEFLFGGEKVVFYFAAEDRIDFRGLVKDLASEYHQRVDMRQIGVRDETRLSGGYATCGQELCCVRFKGDFEPVSIRMAKEQDLALNSVKISGVCGRLMCCLRYEFEAYKDFKQRAPKKNAVIDTPLGKAKIVEYNTPRETITMRLENGKSFTVALKDMTCSEQCMKHAAEQNGPVRPDTVTREVLESLGTAEIMLQLAELDRSNNPDYYLLDTSLVEEDISELYKAKPSQVSTTAAEPQRTQRKVAARSNEQAKEEKTQEQQAQGRVLRKHTRTASQRQTTEPEAQPQESKATVTRRRTHTSSKVKATAVQTTKESPAKTQRPAKTRQAVAVESKQQETPVQPKANQRPTRRRSSVPAAQTTPEMISAPESRHTRRHHVSTASTSVALPAKHEQQPVEQTQSQQPRRRRVPASADTSVQIKATAQTTAPKPNPSPTPTPRRRRRPGDKGGN